MSLYTRQFCCFCNSQSGSTSCEGCGRKFCFPCLQDHRKEMMNDLEILANRRNEIKEAFERCRTTNSSSTQQIDQWAKEMHIKIDQIAQKTKDQVQRLLSRTTEEIRSKLDQISDEIRLRQKSQEILDSEVEMFKETLQNLDKNVQQMNQNIRIDTSKSQNIDWDSLISVISSTSSVSNPPKGFLKPKVLDRFAAAPVYDNGHRNPQNVQEGVSLPAEPPAWTPPHAQPARSVQPIPKAQHAHGSKKSFRTYRCICCKSENSYRENTVNVCSVCKTKYNY